MKTLGDRVANWLRRQVFQAGARGLVVGVSGGLDSAVVARLSQMAFPESMLAVLMPCLSDPQDESDARFVAKQFRIPNITIDLSETYTTFLTLAQKAINAVPVAGTPVPIGAGPDIRARVPLANVKPRLRMTTLYLVANRLNYLVAGTGNRSEIAIGYFTKYGDGGCDVLPLGSMVKSEVRGLARELGIPKAIIEKTPSAGLWIGQRDEEEMGCTYVDLDAYLTQGAEILAPALALKINRLARATDHKRTMPAVFEGDEKDSSAS